MSETAPLLQIENLHASAGNIAILKGVRGRYEEHHGLKITDEALEVLVRISAPVGIGAQGSDSAVAAFSLLIFFIPPPRWPGRRGSPARSG